MEVNGALTVVGHVHHVRDVGALSETNRQTKLRRALDSLEGPQPDIAGLLATVNRLILDDDHEMSSGPAKPSAKDAPQKVPEPSGPLGPLALSLSSATRKQRKRRRLLKEGGLASLLDALIYQLGKGLDLVTAPTRCPANTVLRLVFLRAARGVSATRHLWVKLWVRSVPDQVSWYHSSGTTEGVMTRHYGRHVTQCHPV